MSHPRADEFIAMLGTRFHVAESPVEITLREATTPQPGVLSLLFHSSSPTLLLQGTYQVTSQGMSESMFLVPVSADEHGTEYEAIFA